MSITQYNSSVRQMSQSKFDSMKNASGKIPDLANQIVMTNSEDTNISCLRTEVVYDMTSSDANINWGYPNGIGTGVTINKDFSKYDFLVCEYLSYNNSIVGFCDLSQPTMPSDTTGRYVLYAVAYVQNGYQELIGIINLEKTTLTTYLPGSGTLAVKIAKIYGILKTPSMIYTGDELIAGNGISIANGVISANGVTVTTLWTGSMSGGQNISIDLSEYDIVLVYSDSQVALLNPKISQTWAVGSHILYNKVNNTVYWGTSRFGYNTSTKTFNCDGFWENNTNISSAITKIEGVKYNG